jgi:hypothetical protein
MMLFNVGRGSLHDSVLWTEVRVCVIAERWTVDDRICGRISRVCWVYSIRHCNLLHDDCSTPVIAMMTMMAVMPSPMSLRFRSSRRTGWNERETNSEGCHKC